MAVGHVKNKIFYSKEGLNKSVVYVGSSGRDGIHGASMASAEFDEFVKKPTVQVEVFLLKSY